MTQSKRHSLIESVTNIAIGMVVSLASQSVIFPLCSVYVSMGTNITITAWFTVISLVRQYAIRRYFNNFRVKA
jgi:hypothetical protein